MKKMTSSRLRHHTNPLANTKEHHFPGFKNSREIWVEVGSGKGEFAEELIQKHPRKNFILFEIRQPLYLSLVQKFAPFPNVRVFDGDAGRNFREILLPSISRGVTVKKVFINFPDPWFKKKQQKRRFINSSFLQKTQKYIKGETEFIFQTDQKSLFDFTWKCLNEHYKLCNPALSKTKKLHRFASSPQGIQTHWEKAKIAQQQKIWRLRFYL